jgi:radical SAM-linked protein
VADTSALLGRTGYEEVSLLSLSTGDYSGVNPVLKALMDRLTPQRVAVSLPSTRVDALSPRILEEIRRVRKTGFTLAPEAGTQRLRDVIQKEYREADLLAAARTFADLGWRSLKLYFMIGLPSETEEDVLGIAVLAERVRKAARGRLKVTASVSTFSPKPHTPFQWAAQLTLEETRARQALLRHELARRGIEFRWHDAELSFLEGVFARGDRRLADVIETAQRRGARFDGWSDRCRIDVWRESLAEHGFDPLFYLRRRPLGEVLPWDHLDAGVSKKFLRQDLARAVEGRLTPDCSIERCTYCGACDFEAVRNVDYHLAGAKGGDHRGGRVSRWAERVVPSPDDRVAWETRAWHEIRARVASRRANGQPAAAMARPVETTPLPAALVSGATTPTPAEPGEGNAQEWLGAVPSSLTPDAAAPQPVQRLRLRYRKIGPARFLGGRELGTLFLRAARRAALPLAFSQGHHPLPKIAFGPALPLGTSSDDEYIDVELAEATVPDTVAARLAAELPEGLEPIGVADIPRSAPSIERDIDAFAYEVDLRSLDAPPASETVAAAVARFAGAQSFPVRKHSKSGERTVDARHFIRRLDLAGPGRLALEIAAGQDGTLKPEVFLGELLTLAPSQRPGLRVHKVATRFRAAAGAAT